MRAARQENVLEMFHQNNSCSVPPVVKFSLSHCRALWNLSSKLKEDHRNSLQWMLVVGFEGISSLGEGVENGIGCEDSSGFFKNTTAVLEMFATKGFALNCFHV